MDYQLIRSNRRTVALVIDRQGNLIVRSPRRAEISEIEKFIQLKIRWIEKHRQRALLRLSKQKQYVEGESFLFLGQGHPLRIVDGSRRRLVFDQGQFLLSRPQVGRAKQLFADWYRGQAKYLLPRRVVFWRQKMAVDYRGLTITGAQSRWGSCSATGTISLSWRLMAAPLAVVDYVVIHELAHLRHHNHSQRFWQVVGQFCPDYRAAKSWLKDEGHSIIL